MRLDETERGRNPTFALFEERKTIAFIKKKIIPVLRRLIRFSLRWLYRAFVICAGLYLIVAFRPDDADFDDSDMGPFVNINYNFSDPRAQEIAENTGFIDLALAISGTDQRGRFENVYSASAVWFGNEKSKPKPQARMSYSPVNAMSHPQKPGAQMPGRTGVRKIDKPIKKSEQEEQADRVKYRRNPTEAQIKLLNDDYGYRIEKVRRIINKYDTFEIPYGCRGYADDRRWFCNIVYGPGEFDVNRVLVMQAWYDLRHGNPEGALDKIDAALRIADIFENEVFDRDSNGIGRTNKTNTAIEFSSMLDSNLIPPHLLKSFLLEFQKYPVRKESMIRALKDNYQYDRDFLLGNDFYDKDNEKKLIKYYCDYTIYNVRDSQWFCKTFLVPVAVRPLKTLKKLHILHSYIIDEANKKKHDFLKYGKSFPHEVFGERIRARCACGSITDDTIDHDLIKAALSANTFGDTIIYLEWQSHHLIPVYEALYETFFNLALTKAAILTYKQQHGALPPDLKSLVPDFLLSVPKDPFTGEPLKYSPTKNIVYSVGYNAKDDGGVETKDPFEYKRYSETSAMKDLVLQIDTPRKTSAQ